jgi:hypothetical protein
MMETPAFLNAMSRHPRDRRMEITILRRSSSSDIEVSNAVLIKAFRFNHSFSIGGRKLRNHNTFNLV